MDTDSYTLDTARDAASDGRLDEWVAGFLASPGSDNAPLGAELTKRHRHWLGPMLLPLDELNRFVGPEGDPVLVEVGDDYWDSRVDDMAEKIDDGFVPPPFIVSYEEGQLHLEDGNHRVESLRRSGETEGWAVVGFEKTEDLERFAGR
jgi:hypothetical protein